MVSHEAYKKTTMQLKKIGSFIKIAKLQNKYLLIKTHPNTKL